MKGIMHLFDKEHYMIDAKHFDSKNECKIQYDKWIMWNNEGGYIQIKLTISTANDRFSTTEQRTAKIINRMPVLPEIKKDKPGRPPTINHSIYNTNEKYYKYE